MSFTLNMAEHKLLIQFPTSDIIGRCAAILFFQFWQILLLFWDKKHRSSFHRGLILALMKLHEFSTEVSTKQMEVQFNKCYVLSN